jgi:Fic family protein
MVLELTQADGRAFWVCMHSGLLQRVASIDASAAELATLWREPGAARAGEAGGGIAALRQLAVRTRMDEAVESSRVEGAATTYRQGVDLLTSGRVPASPGERMIANNHAGLERIEHLAGVDLSVAMLCELQGILTHGTLASSDGVGRLRRPGDGVRIEDQRSGETSFVPPDASMLPDRLDRLCRFASDDLSNGRAMHPVIKACVLHFMIGYEHPFVDGNGRTARAVFYWHMLRRARAEFLGIAISPVILSAYAGYPQAFVDVEHDSGDLTYFIEFKLGVIERAIDAARTRTVEQVGRLRSAPEITLAGATLNLRQRLVLEHAMREPDAVFTAIGHASAHGVTAMTARTDLKALATLGFLRTFKDGRELHFVASADLRERLARARGPGDGSA